MINYSENDITKMCDEALKNINTFYRQGFVNYIGTTADSKLSLIHI